MIKCYQIVPISNGYTRLCESKGTGLLYLESKGNVTFEETILFLSKAKAEDWLRLRNMKYQYFVEECWLSPNVAAQCNWRD